MDENFDIEKIMNMVKVIQAISSTDSEPKEENQEAIKEDKEVSAIDTIKAAIPYLDTKFQKNIGVFVKVMELNRLLNNFQAMNICSNDKERRIKMLQAVKPELDYKKQKLLDVFVRVIEIKDIMEEISYE